MSVVIVIVIVSSIHLKWVIFDFRNYCIIAYTFYSYKLIFAKLLKLVFCDVLKQTLGNSKL